MTSWKQAPGDNRSAQRFTVEEGSHLAHGAHVVVPGKTREHKCRVADYSATGYRVLLLPPLLEARKYFAPEQEAVLGRRDGWQRTVSVRWIEGNQLGLMILNPVTRLILSEQEAYECTLLASQMDMIRVALEPQPELPPSFNLELPNGDVLPVQVRWSRDEELCLQLVPQVYRLPRRV
jgi:hypothetical protein